MREAIDYSIEHSYNISSFDRVMKSQGYVVNTNPHRRYWTIRSVNSNKAVRMYRLGEEYTNDAILRRIKVHYQQYGYRHFDEYHYDRVKMRDYHPKKVKYRGSFKLLKCFGGLYATYLHYCYLLGKLPKWNQRRPLSPEMREAWRHLDRFSGQITLVSNQKLNTLDDVRDYINHSEQEIKEVTELRQKIYNKLRRCDDEGRMQIIGSGGSTALPKLNAVSISRNGDTITISNPSTNGGFVVDYAICDGDNIITTRPATSNAFVVTAMKDILMRGMHKYSCASIPNRGGTYALKYQRKMIQRKKKSSKYAAELDIKQFYPSIPQRHVITALEHKIKDKKFIMLVAVIISVFPRGLKYAIKNKMTAYDIVSDKIGIDIGFYINQWLSNYLLEPIDRFINSCDGIKGECRYADNINLFASNKRKLHRAVRALQNKLKRLGLRLKENWQIFSINARPLSSVGYRIARGFVLLRKRNFLRLTRQARRIMKKIKNHRKIPECMARSIISRIGQLGRCNSLKIKQNTYIR